MRSNDAGQDQTALALLRMAGSLVPPESWSIQGQLRSHRTRQTSRCYCEAMGAIDVLSAEDCVFEQMYSRLSSGLLNEATGIEFFLEHQTSDTRHYRVATVTAQLAERSSPEIMLVGMRIVPGMEVDISTVWPGAPPRLSAHVRVGERVLEAYGPATPPAREPYKTVSAMLKYGASTAAEIRAEVPHLHVSLDELTAGHLVTHERSRSLLRERLWDAPIVSEVIRPLVDKLIRSSGLARPIVLQPDRKPPSRLEDLRAQFAELQSAEPQPRGYGLERLLIELLSHSGLSVFRGFTRCGGGEQIDLAFHAEGWFYLVECRWRAEPMNIRDFDGLSGQLGRSGKQTMGIVMAINGWSEHVPELLKRNTCKNIVLMNGEDLRCVFAGEIELRELLHAKLAALTLKGEPFLTAHDVRSLR